MLYFYIIFVNLLLKTHSELLRGPHVVQIRSSTMFWKQQAQKVAWFYSSDGMQTISMVSLN